MGARVRFTSAFVYEGASSIRVQLPPWPEALVSAKDWSLVYTRLADKGSYTKTQNTGYC